MICAQCEKATEGAPCENCGDDPLLEGRYKLIRRVGQGANGTTYKAVRLADDMEVAVKELLVRNAHSLHALELFEREARTLRAIDHPNVPAYYEDFTTNLGPNVGMYIVQQFVPGRTLGERMEDGPLEPSKVLEIVRDVALTLQYLHGLTPPVVHRDIKPDNLIARRPGAVAVLDFGSVQEAIGDGGDRGVPTMAGTMGYMSPEQLGGIATPASDVFSLGATARALLVGGAPHESDVDWSVGLPPQARALLTQMQAVQPQNRPSAAEVYARAVQISNETNASHALVVKQAAALARLGEVPRPIPRNWRWGSSVGRGPAFLALAAAVFLGVPLLLVGLWPVGVPVVAFATLYGAVSYYADRAEVRRTRTFTHGETVIGRIVLSSPGLLLYEYEAEGARLKGKYAEYDFPEAAPGDPILVFYEPGKPDKPLLLAELTHDQQLAP